MAKKPSVKSLNNAELDISDSASTVEEYFKYLEAGFKDITNARIKQEKAIADAQKKYIEDNLEKYAKEVEKNIITQEELKAKLIQDFQKEQSKKERETALAVAKIKYANQTVKGYNTAFGEAKERAERNKERERNHEQNMELYSTLKALGSNRTADQNKQLKAVSKELWQESGFKALKNTMNNLVNSLNKLNAGIDKYASYSGKINARLQGYNTGATLIEKSMAGTFQPFGILENRLSGAVGITPYFKTEVMLDNLQTLVEAGIAANVEQRAFLQTAKENIATTFDVANGALLRIIRLQQQDSTAARLGMEAYLTRFLNELVSNTEYLTSTFDNVQEALVEMSSQMTAQASTELEFVIQKWLGALTGVGLSDTTATSIAQALGYLGSGNVEALSGTNLQNLLVMASSRAGLSYADLLTQGLSAQNADLLMQSLVSYMGEIGGSSNNVVRSQFAQTFGLNVSDLRAAQELQSSLSTIAGVMMSFGDMYEELGTQLTQIPLRLNMASMLDTVWANVEWGLSSNIARNPALAAIWKVTGLIQENTGGINIPFITALGTGFDLNTTIENLVKLGIVGISSLGMIGDVVSGVASSVAPTSILGKLGITSGNSTIVRGTVADRYKEHGELSTSLSAMIVNSSGEDISSSALAGSRDQAQEELTNAQQDTEDSVKAIKDYLVDTINTNLLSIDGAIKAVQSSLASGIEVKVTSMPESYMSVLSTFGM